MKQWTTLQDGIKNLQFDEIDAPTSADLRKDEVLVQVKVVALNYRDTEVSEGTYGHHASLQDKQALVPCSDMCGIVVASRSSRWSEGARVLSTFNQSHVSGQIRQKDLGTGLGLPLSGCLTEYRVFPAVGLVEAPAHLSDAEASTLPIASVTAWMSLNSFEPMDKPVTGKDKIVLLQGTGGVSIAGLQIAKALSLTTIITSSSDEKLEKAKALGADHTINYRKDTGWDETVMKLTNGHGADIVFETGGTETLLKSFNCVAFGGLISAIGYLSGKADSTSERLNVNVLALRRNVTLKGMLNGPRDRFEEMIRLVYTQAKGIKPVIDRTFPFEQTKDALEYLASGSHFGKVVIEVSK